MAAGQGRRHSGSGRFRLADWRAQRGPAAAIDPQAGMARAPAAPGRPQNSMHASRTPVLHAAHSQHPHGGEVCGVARPRLVKYRFAWNSSHPVYPMNLRPGTRLGPR